MSMRMSMRKAVPYFIAVMGLILYSGIKPGNSL
jgi:hypothetical protein